MPISSCSDCYRPEYRATWRERLIAACGPGLFGGVTFGDSLKILLANHGRVHPVRLLNVIATAGTSLGNSLMRQVEIWRYGSQIAETKVHPPLFILGHWRSGTTHLHNLLCQDQRFGYPTFYQVLFPHTFLATESVVTRWTAGLLPKGRSGLDNVRFGWHVPYEDEFATACMTFRSPYLGVIFPHRQAYYDRYLTFQGVPEREIVQWQTALMLLLKKLTWKYERPLILKSPPHTCRIRLLLAMFPDAKFVHIRRHPLTVFQSTQKMYALASWWWSMQSTAKIDWTERIIRQYHEMYQAYLEQRSLIPPGQLHEISFEQLEMDPLGQLRTLYEALRLPDFSQTEPSIRAYLNSLTGYQKNRFPELGASMRSRLLAAWGRYLSEWGYMAQT